MLLWSHAGETAALDVFFTKRLCKSLRGSSFVLLETPRWLLSYASDTHRHTPQPARTVGTVDKNVNKRCAQKPRKIEPFILFLLSGEGMGERQTRNLFPADFELDTNVQVGILFRHFQDFRCNPRAATLAGYGTQQSQVQRCVAQGVSCSDSKPKVIYQ